MCTRDRESDLSLRFRSHLHIEDRIGRREKRLAARKQNNPRRDEKKKKKKNYERERQIEDEKERERRKHVVIGSKSV